MILSFPALRLAEVEICEKMGGAYPIRYKSLPSLRLPLIFVYNSVEFASRSVCRSITLKLWRKNIQLKEEEKKHRRVHLLIKPRRHKSSWFNLDSWSNKFHTWKKRERKRKVIVDKLRKKDNFSTKKKIEKREKWSHKLIIINKWSHEQHKKKENKKINLRKFALRKKRKEKNR